MKKTTSTPSTRAAFATLLMILFFSTNIIVIYRVPLSLNLFGWVYAWLLELALFGLAYDLSEVILCLIYRETHLPSLPFLERHPSVALVCVTCDDTDEDTLLRLSHQSYPTLGVFILDDSQLPESRKAIDKLGLNVVRRKGRDGYKAGNLNNWLFKYGSDYEYLVVADADSILPGSFVSEMVRAAEHPDNRQLAIIESIIYPWNDQHSFVKPQSIQSPFQRCRRLRLLNRLDSTLSVGHNNIYRTSALLDIGGFQEDYIAEDYATTIQLLQRTPWKCKTASVRSYERLPANLREYARRQSRWSYQTFQLCSMNTQGLPWETRLALLRALYHFSMPVTAHVAMLWLIAVNITQSLTGPKIDSSQMANRLIEHPAFIFWLSWLIGPTILRLALLLREGVPLTDCIRSTFLQAALFFATAWPVIRRLASLLRPHCQRFDVTGRSPDPRLWDSIKLSGPSLLLSWITLLSFLPVPLHAMLNATWLIPACFSPFLLHQRGVPNSERRPY